MLDFPKSTIFNKRIAKQKVYDGLKISTSFEKQIIKEIDTIYWKNKLSSDTLNISEGKYVNEIEIFEITLKGDTISKNLIEFLDREIPYHIVFVIKKGDLGQIWVSLKEYNKNREGKFKVDTYFITCWLRYEDLSLKIDGLNLDKVYENFILQVSNGKIQIDDGENIKDAVDNAKMIEKLEKEEKRIDTRIRNEKQFNQQVQLMRELRNVKAKLKNYRK